MNDSYEADCLKWWEEVKAYAKIMNCKWLPDEMGKDWQWLFDEGEHSPEEAFSEMMRND